MYVSHHLTQQFLTQTFDADFQVKRLPVAGQNRRQTLSDVYVGNTERYKTWEQSYESRFIGSCNKT